MTSIASLFVNGSPNEPSPQHGEVVGDENKKRLLAFMQTLVGFSSSFDRNVFKILVGHGVEPSHAMRIIDGSLKKGSCVLSYPSTTPIYIERGDKACVTINMTTIKLIDTDSSSFAKVDESVLRSELASIEENKHKSVLVVLVALNTLLERSRRSADDPDFLELQEAEVLLIVPSVRFLVEVVKSDRYGDHLAFSVGAHHVTKAPVLALQIGFDVLKTLPDGGEPLPGRSEFAQLVSYGVQLCHKGWAKTNPFINYESLVSSSLSSSLSSNGPERSLTCNDESLHASRNDIRRTIDHVRGLSESAWSTRISSDCDVTDEHDAVETKRAKIIGRMASCEAE